MGTPVQKMPAGTGALWVGESRGPRGLGYHFLLGLALRRKKFLCTLPKAEEESKNVCDWGVGGGGTEFLLQT